MVEVVEGPNNDLQYKYYLLHVTPTAFDNREDLVKDTMHSYFRAGTCFLKYIFVEYIKFDVPLMLCC